MRQIPSSGWRPGRCALRLVRTLLAVIVVGLCFAGASRASDTVTAVAPSPVTLGASATVSVPGAQVADTTTPSATLQVTVSTTLGTLTLPSNTSSLTLAYGYTTFSGPTITFTGTATNVNAALSAMQLTGGGSTGTATISVNVTPSVPGVNFLPPTGHYYQYVATGSTADTWTQAAAAANAMSFDGQQGYLAAVPNATVNTFIQNHLASGDTNIWAGGQASDFSGGNGPDGSYRAWYWGGQNGSTTPGQANYGGPLAGQVFTECGNLTGNCAFENTSSFFYNGSSIGSGVWYYANSSDQEPNNDGGTESYLAINYSFNGAATGKWNDFSNGESSSTGFVVEYGDESTGASSWSSSASASSSSTLATAPGVSTGVSATAGPTGSGNLLVSWTAPASNGNSAITAYTVTATPASGSPATCTTTGAVECTVGGLTPGAQYTVSVAATNVIGTGSGSAGTVAYAPLAIPGAPTGVSTNPGAAGSGAVAVSWSAPANTGGSPVTAYSVTATPGSGPTETCNTTGATTCTLDGLAPSTTYAVTVTDTTAAGTSSAATASVQSPGASVPSAPTGVSASPGAYGSAQIAVSWSSPYDGDSPITAYTVTATPTSGNSAAQTCATTGGLSCTVGGLQPGITYTVTVSATNAVGTGGLGSTTVSAPISVPGAPVGPTATPGATGTGAITLSWSAPASTGGGSITAYTVTATPTSGNSSARACSTNGADSCTVTGLVAGAQYTLSVVATNLVGTGNAATTTASAPLALPGAPTGLSTNPGAAGSGDVAVSWSAPASDGGSAVTGYSVSLQGGGSTQTCTTAGATTCTVNGLAASTTYAVSVTATTTVGTSSAATASVLSPAASVPTPPTGLSATPGMTNSDDLLISWSAPNSDGDSPILGYTVTATPTSGNSTAQTCTTNGGLSCTVGGLDPGAQYTVSVIAINLVGTGNPATTTASAPLAHPEVPTGVSAAPGSAGSQAVTVSWSAPADGGSPITGYTVTATPQGNGSPQTCTTIATTCTISGLEPGAAYTVTVTATNAIGTGGAGSTSASAPASHPSAPTGLTATPGPIDSNTLLVSWSAPASTGGSPITGYTVTATPTSGQSAAQTCTTNGGLSCAVGGLSPGVAYTLAVTAANVTGIGSAAATPAQAPLALPGAPTGLDATPGVAGSAMMTVSWAAPASDGGSPVTGYTVIATPTTGSSAARSCTTSDATSCTVTGLDPGGAYTVTLTATTAAGIGADATTFATAPPTTVPAAPGGLTATPGAPGSGTVALTWIASSGDGGSPITAYTVSTSSQGDVTEPGCTTATVTACTISGLTAGVTYTFTLAAINAVGSSSTISVTALAPADATTAPTPPTPAAGVAAAPAATLNAGLVTSTAGALTVPLTCVGAGDCTADGTLTTRAGPSGGTLQLASFSGVEIGPGGAVSVPSSISPAARLALYKRAVYRVRVTLTVASHLSDGETAVSVQPLWLNVSRITGCQNDVGRLTVRRVGRLRLGMRRRAALRLGRHWQTGVSGERFAVAGGAIRVAFPDAALLRTVSAHRRTGLAHRVMIVLTANRHYSANGVKVGMTVSQARRALHLGRGIMLGGRTWYLERVARGTLVVKTRRGVVREVGTAARVLTRTRARDIRLLHHL